MLTVNIQVSGNQITMEAKLVEAMSHNSSFTYDAVALTMPDNEIHMIHNGQIFVMNEAGSTVAKYNLGEGKWKGPLVPHPDQPIAA